MLVPGPERVFEGRNDKVTADLAHHQHQNHYRSVSDHIIYAGCRLDVDRLDPAFVRPCLGVSFERMSEILVITARFTNQSLEGRQ